MSTPTENIRLWMAQADPDYYLFFLKAWIPFNAWYVAEYPQLLKKDGAIIKELQDGITSKPKKIIKNLLENEAQHDALRFKSCFAELHYQLMCNPLYHNGTRLSFENLNLGQNHEKIKHYSDKQGNLYKAERTSSYFQAFIQAKNGKTLLDFKHPIHDIAKLDGDTSFLRLESRLRNQVRELFQAIDPNKPGSIISKSTAKHDCVRIKAKNPCSIIKDCEVVAKACISVLYALRCMLFHGEVPPTESNRQVYENAFYILQLIVSRLK